jgi:hypothetical protein
MTRTLVHATRVALREEEFSVRSVPKCCMQDEYRFQLVVRHSPASKGMNTEAEECTALKAVTRKRTVKTQQIKKS